MNTQIKPLEIPLKGTATQIFIRTSTDGIYNPTTYRRRSRSVGRFYGVHRKSCIKTVKFDVKIARKCRAKLFQLCNQ